MTGATGYFISLRDVTTGASTRYTVGISVNTYGPSGLVAGDSYSWNVSALSGTQKGPASSALFFELSEPVTTLAAPVESGPGSTTSPGPLLTTSTPTLGWIAITGQTGYLVNFYDVTTSKLVSYTVGASATSFTVPAGAIRPGDSYVWNVRGLNGTQTGPPGANLYFQTQAVVTTLAAPTAISPGSTTSPGPILTTDAPTFVWNAVPGVTGYQINVYDGTAGKSTSYVVGASVTSYSPGSLTPGDKYVWNVRVLNGTQSGPPSTYFNFQTPAANGSTVGNVPPAVINGVATSVLTPSLSGALPALGIAGKTIHLHQTVTLTNATGGVVNGSAKGTLYLSPDPTLDSTSIPVMTSGRKVRLKAGKLPRPSTSC